MAFSDMVLETGLGAIDLQGRQVELSGKLAEFVNERVDDEFGLNIPEMTMNISLPDEITQAMTAGVARGVEASGFVENVDLDKYQQAQAADAMVAAAENPGGSVMGDMMQMGMGVAMAGQMANQMGGIGAPAGNRSGRARRTRRPAPPPHRPSPASAVPRRPRRHTGRPVQHGPDAVRDRQRPGDGPDARVERGDARVGARPGRSRTAGAVRHSPADAAGLTDATAGPGVSCVTDERDDLPPPLPDPGALARARADARRRPGLRVGARRHRSVTDPPAPRPRLVGGRSHRRIRWR